MKFLRFIGFAVLGFLAMRGIVNLAEWWIAR